MLVCHLLPATLLAIASSAFAQTDSTHQGLPPREVVDSLKAGRQRWARAGVVEYRIQSHADCFCIYLGDAFERQLPLLTVRHDSIIAREKGNQTKPPSPERTIAKLFDDIENDASSDGRIIEELKLDPIFGFPKLYKARDPLIPDAWVWLQVDSFVVIRRQ